MKLVDAVPASSAKQDVPTELRGNNEQREKQKRELRIYAEKLEERLAQRGTITIQEVSAYMRQYVIGWWDAMRENRLIGSTALTRFLQLYPNKFEIVGTGTRLRVRLA